MEMKCCGHRIDLNSPVLILKGDLWSLRPVVALWSNSNVWVPVSLWMDVNNAGLIFFNKMNKTKCNQTLFLFTRKLHVAPLIIRMIRFSHCFENQLELCKCFADRSLNMLHQEILRSL